MKTFLSIVLAGSLAVGMSSLSFAQDGGKDGGKGERRAQRGDKAAAGAKVGEAAPGFTLKTADGKDWSLSDAAGKVVVIEWVNPECPVCERVMKDGTVAATLKGVKDQFPDAVYLAINSSAARPSSFDATPDYLKNNKIDIPALFDRDGAVGKQYGARTTPHCFVIDLNRARPRRIVTKVMIRSAVRCIDQRNGGASPARAAVLVCPSFPSDRARPSGKSARRLRLTAARRASPRR